jgi:EAL domain-containing protein (putative c-di-GMP-specific phosphodiesterase class I)
MENKLRNALDNNECYLCYQPRINLVTGEIASFEALLRWNNKELGLVSPEQFIPMAETTGLIIPIGDWVLTTACKQMDEWNQLGLYIPISVNLSPSQFYSKDLLSSVIYKLTEFQIDASQLEFEITESTVMQDIALALHTVEELKSLGLRIAMDDFGTGQSSLTNLRRLPVDTLKIDKSFVQETGYSPESKSIVQAIITLGHVLNLTVTAEGVETNEQLAVLRHLGCDEVQGYFFSRPVPAKDAYEMLVSGNLQANQLRTQLALDSSAL